MSPKSDDEKIGQSEFIWKGGYILIWFCRYGGYPVTIKFISTWMRCLKDVFDDRCAWDQHQQPYQQHQHQVLRMPLMIVVLGLGIVMLVCVVVLVALLLCNNSSGDEDDCRLVCNTDSIFLCYILYFIFLCSFYSIDIILIQTEVRFVTAVTAGGSVKFLPAV